jgi:hypothetical protein
MEEDRNGITQKGKYATNQKIKGFLPPLIQRYQYPILITVLVVSIIGLTSVVLNAVNDPQDTVDNFVHSTRRYRKNEIID